MKIDELPRLEPGLSQLLEGPMVRMYLSQHGEYLSHHDLPPQRDAKTDPPPEREDVIFYVKGRQFHGIGLYYDARWHWYDPDFGLTQIDDEVEFWREILW